METIKYELHHANTGGSVIGTTTNHSREEIAALVAEGICPCNIYWHTEEKIKYNAQYGIHDELLPALNPSGQCPICACFWAVRGIA